MTTPTATVDAAVVVQDQARQTYRQSIQNGKPLSGRELGAMYERSERWGRARIEESRAAQNGNSVRQNGSAQVVGSELSTGNAMVGTANAAGTLNTSSVAVPAVDQPSGARAVAWSAFLLGIAASIAANVAHAQPAFGPRIAAAFVPLALLLAVECMSRPRWHRSGTWWGLARYGGTGLVATVAAVMSYRHMSALLRTYGEDQLNSAIGPLAVDGLMVVAGFALLAMSPQDDQAKTKH